MPSILATARSLALDVEAFVLPRACVACEALVRREDAVLCERCAHALRPLAPPGCARCGQTLDRWEREAGGSKREAGYPALHASRVQPPAWCGFCRDWPAALTWAASAAWFDDGPARRLVHSLKYDGWRCAAEPMAEAIARRCAARLVAVDALVPVPLGRTRRRERGHNQAELLAAALARRTGLRHAAGLLARTRETRSQTSLDPAARHANVAGAFAAAARVGGLRLALVDDVLTTGATLVAAARALAAAGAAPIGAVTFARAPTPA